MLFLSLSLNNHIVHWPEYKENIWSSLFWSRSMKEYYWITQIGRFRSILDDHRIMHLLVTLTSHRSQIRRTSARHLLLYKNVCDQMERRNYSPHWCTASDQITASTSDWVPPPPLCIAAVISNNEMGSRRGGVCTYRVLFLLLLFYYKHYGSYWQRREEEAAAVSCVLILRGKEE